MKVKINKFLQEEYPETPYRRIAFNFVEMESDPLKSEKATSFSYVGRIVVVEGNLAGK